MNKKIITTALALSVLASANAFAASKNYVRADVAYGGYSTSDMKLTDGTTTTTLKTENKKGFAGDLGIGYNVSKNVRAEGEFYADNGLKAKIKGLSASNSAHTKTKTVALFGNVYYDFNNSTKFSPYVMAGLGFANNKYEVSQQGAVANSKGSASKTQFAGQIGAGVAFKATDNVSLDLGYRLMQKSFSKSTFKNAAGDKVSIDNKPNHMIMAGVRVGF